MEALQRFRAEHDLPFVLLSDPDREVTQQYGAWGEKTIYGRTVEGLLRSHFVLDEAGVVLDAQIRIGPEESVEKAVSTLVGQGEE